MKKKTVMIFALAMGLLVGVLAATNAAVPIWADNFDGYPTGTSLHGVGGWKGFLNDPAFTAFTTNVQADNAPNSVDIIGNADLVHEYTVTSGQVCYRFRQYIPGNLLGTSYFIMLNRYDDACATCNWSVEVQHQGSTGLIVDDGTGASMPYVANQWVPVQLEIDLDNDTQAYTYNGVLFYTGTWSQHVSGGGITAIGAADLFANGATSVYYDDMSLQTGECTDLNNRIYLPGVFKE